MNNYAIKYVMMVPMSAWEEDRGRWESLWGSQAAQQASMAPFCKEVGSLAISLTTWLKV